MIEIDEGTSCPKLLLKLLSGDDLTGLPDESRQDLQRLSLNPHSNAMLVQFAGRFIERERTEDELPLRTRSGLTAHWVTEAQAYQI